MVMANETDGNKEFIAQLRQRAEQKAKEYSELLQEQERIAVRLERTKKYVEELNNFLQHEGQRPSLLNQPKPGSIVGKAGNRSKEMPVRKIEWLGMTINEIVPRVLTASPQSVRLIAPQIYEIHDDLDLDKVTKNLRSMLQRGVRLGIWEKIGRGLYKAKIPVAQERLIHA